MKRSGLTVAEAPGASSSTASAVSVKTSAIVSEKRAGRGTEGRGLLVEVGTDVVAGECHGARLVRSSPQERTAPLRSALTVTAPLSVAGGGVGTKGVPARFRRPAARRTKGTALIESHEIRQGRK